MSNLNELYSKRQVFVEYDVPIPSRLVFEIKEAERMEEEKNILDNSSNAYEAPIHLDHNPKTDKLSYRKIIKYICINKQDPDVSILAHYLGLLNDTSKKARENAISNCARMIPFVFQVPTTKGIIVTPAKLKECKKGVYIAKEERDPAALVQAILKFYDKPQKVVRVDRYYDEFGNQLDFDYWSKGKAIF